MVIGIVSMGEHKQICEEGYELASWDEIKELYLEHMGANENGDHAIAVWVESADVTDLLLIERQKALLDTRRLKSAIKWVMDQSGDAYVRYEQETGVPYPSTFHIDVWQRHDMVAVEVRRWGGALDHQLTMAACKILNEYTEELANKSDVPEDYTRFKDLVERYLQLANAELTDDVDCSSYAIVDRPDMLNKLAAEELGEHVAMALDIAAGQIAEINGRYASGAPYPTEEE
jgi:hypothetical protein